MCENNFWSQDAPRGTFTKGLVRPLVLPRTNLAFTGGRWYKINAGLACRLEELGDVGVAKKTHTHHTHIHTHNTHTHITHTHHTHITHTHTTHTSHTHIHTHTHSSSSTHTQHTHTHITHTHTPHTHHTHTHTTHTSHTHKHTHKHTHHTHTQHTHTPTHTQHTHKHTQTQKLAFCVAGVALGDIHFRYAWQKVTSTVVLCGRRGTDGTGWRAWTGLGAAVTPVTPRHSAWQAWHLVTSTLISRGRRGTTSHLPSFCVAGVGQMALGGALGLV